MSMEAQITLETQDLDELTNEIRERLVPLGGALSIDAAPGRGTELRVTIPGL